MALDVLILGGFVFDDFSTPEKLPAGGKHQLIVHKMPGGNRAIDAMGPDDSDRSWSGTFWGEGALGQALALDAMRASGAELPYSNGVEARTAVISDFAFEVRKFQCIEYRITIVLADSGGLGGGFGGFIGLGLSTLDGIVGADLSAAVGLL